MARRFSWGGYFIRLLFAVVLVFVTYNPTGLSYFHWVRGAVMEPGSVATEILALMALIGIVLIIGWVIFIRATYRSLGPFGTILAVAFFGALIWVILVLVPVPRDNLDLIVYLIELGLAGVLSAGLSWSHVRRRLSGQLDVDETDM